MDERKIKVVLLDEALSFVRSLPIQVQEKIVFWDTDTETFVIATHGIVKKSQKTPQKEIVKAEKIREEYFKSK